jgi:hypothetical protein
MMWSAQGTAAAGLRQMGPTSGISGGMRDRRLDAMVGARYGGGGSSISLKGDWWAKVTVVPYWDSQFGDGSGSSVDGDQWAKVRHFCAEVQCSKDWY